ncbi:MAG TPA: hypothetical protein VF601_19350 [Beijerinckiaceae bacterium]
MAEQPAFLVGVDDFNLRLLGEISVIQGHIEACMIATVSHLLKTPIQLARQILGSTKVETNVMIWRDTIRAKCGNSEIVALAETVFKEFRELTRGRNDFIHAVYVYLLDGPDGKVTGLIPASMTEELEAEVVAYRSRDPDKIRAAKEISQVRDQAARLSRAVAHICWTVGEFETPTPWHDKL